MCLGQPLAMLGQRRVWNLFHALIKSAMKMHQLASDAGFCGRGVANPVRESRCRALTTYDTLTPNRSVACRAESVFAANTRSRRSCEYVCPRRQDIQALRPQPDSHELHTTASLKAQSAILPSEKPLEKRQIEIAMTNGTQYSQLLMDGTFL